MQNGAKGKGTGSDCGWDQSIFVETLSVFGIYGAALLCYLCTHQLLGVTLMKESEENWKIPSARGLSQVLLLIACLITSGI